MARKRKKATGKPFCYYCGRGFPDEKVLIQHQRARHFKCKKCYKKMSTAHALMNHMYQVHKETMKKVQNAKEGRDSIELAIYGMNGVPQEVIDQRNEREAKKGSDDESSENSGGDSDDGSEGEDEVKEEAPPPRPAVAPVVPPMMPQPPFNPMMMGMRPPMPMPGFYPPPPMGMPPMMAGRGLQLPPSMSNLLPMMGRGMSIPNMDTPPPPSGPPPSFSSSIPPQTVFQPQSPFNFANHQAPSSSPISNAPSPLSSLSSPSSSASSSSYTGGRTGPVEGEEVDKKGNIKVLFVYKDDLSMEEKRALLPRYRDDDAVALSQSPSVR